MTGLVSPAGLGNVVQYEGMLGLAQLLRTPQPVDKVVIQPVGTPNRARTYGPMRTSEDAVSAKFAEALLHNVGFIGEVICVEI